MIKKDIRDKVVRAITSHQEMSGRLVGQIHGNTCPLRDIEGFDSLSAEEATVMLSELLGRGIPLDKNPFFSNDGRRAHSVDEIVDTIYSMIVHER